MSELSFVSPAQPIIEPDGVSAKWLEATGQYIVQLGPARNHLGATNLHLAAPIARAVIASLHEAMAARGDTAELPRPDAEQTALDQLAELTREVEFMHPLTGHGPRLRVILAHLGHVAAASESSDEDEDYDAVAVISDERLAELREQLAAEKRAAGAGDAL